MAYQFESDASVTSTPQRTVPGYELAPPSEQDLIMAMARMVGVEDARATWTGVRAACGPAHPESPMTLDQLHSAAELLAQRPGLKVPARAFAIRLNSYRMLSNLDSA
jgi:hypothetical protein